MNESMFFAGKAGPIFRFSVLFLVYGLFAILFWPFAKSIIFAVLFAFALNPVLKKLRRHKLRFSRFKNLSEKWLVLGLVNSIVGLFFIPLILIIISGVSTVKALRANGLQNSSLFMSIETALTRLSGIAKQFSLDYGFDIADQLDLKEKAVVIGEKLFEFFTTMVTQLPWFLFQFLVFCFTLYFILVNRNQFRRWFTDLGLLTKEQVLKFSEVFEGTCYLVLISSVFVATAQALIVCIACAFAGYTDFLIIFLIAFFMSFVPVVGSAPLTLALIAHSIFQAEYGAMMILIVAGAFAGTIDNVIRTYMLTQQEDSSSPLVSLLSLIGAMTLFGFLGLFLGPIITELAFKISKIIFADVESVAEIASEGGDQ